MKNRIVLSLIALSAVSCSQNTAMIDTYKESLSIENNYSTYDTLLASSTQDRVMQLENVFWDEVKSERSIKQLVGQYGVSYLLFTSEGKSIVSEKYLEEVAQGSLPKSNLWKYFFVENGHDLFYYRNAEKPNHGTLPK